MPGNIRDLLASCRHAREEMLALTRQTSYISGCGKGEQEETEAYHHALEAHRQDMVGRLALLEDMIPTL